MFENSRRRVLKATGLGGVASVAGCIGAPTSDTPADTDTRAQQSSSKATTAVDRVAADPTDIPDPVDWSSPKTHEVELEVKEVRAEIEPGVTFDYMTFDGQVPGPMIRVRRGDTVKVTVDNPGDNNLPHNIDLHAVYGTGGGAGATTANPGEKGEMKFQAKYPGAYIYHCAVPNLDRHISAGMYGLILVEPEDGLPEVDNEFYFGQNEIYTDKAAGTEGHHKFDMAGMQNEEPTYVVLNGEKYAITPDRYGSPKAETGETSRVFMVCGGPNLPSYFHPIGNVWTTAYPNGAVASQPDRFAQTMTVAPGSGFVGTMDHPVPETIKLVDHALSRVARKGLMGTIQVEGEEKPGVFDPDP